MGSLTKVLANDTDITAENLATFSCEGLLMTMGNVMNAASRIAKQATIKSSVLVNENQLTLEVKENGD